MGNKVNLEWESVNDDSQISSTERAKVFGGWLVKITDEVLRSMHEDQPLTEGYEWRTSICFVPDINHEWGYDFPEAPKAPQPPKARILSSS